MAHSHGSCFLPIRLFQIASAIGMVWETRAGCLEHARLLSILSITLRQGLPDDISVIGGHLPAQLSVKQEASRLIGASGKEDQVAVLAIPHASRLGILEPAVEGDSEYCSR